MRKKLQMDTTQTEMVTTHTDLSGTANAQLRRRALLKAGAATAGLLTLGMATATPAHADQQSGWKWCNRCQCLFYADNHTTGWCSSGGGHNWAGSGSYTPSHGAGSYGQGGWRWCVKCQNLWWGGSNSKGHCSSGGGHSKRGSGEYYMGYGTPHYGEQEGWRWCRKCYCFTYSLPRNSCAAGKSHDWRGSGNYYCAFE